MLRRWLVVAALAIAAPAQARPVLSGTELTRPSADGHVLLHFTLTGADAIAAADVAPANGVPDVVDAAEQGLATTWSAFVDADGWPAPLADAGTGGDDRLDIYLREVGFAGLAHVEPLAGGGESCFIELDRDAIIGAGVFAANAGHELHHCLEFAVATGLSPWIYEATATYAQYRLFDGDPQLAFARDFHWQARLANSHRAMDAVGDQFEYAGMVWLDFVIDRGGGDRAQLLALWQAMATAGTWEAGHDAFFTAAGAGSLADAAGEFGEWAWFACARDDGRHFDPATIPCGNPATVMEVRATPTDSGTSIAVGLRGTTYVRLDPDDAATGVTLTLRPHDAMQLQIIEWTEGGESPIRSWTGGAGEEWVVSVDDWNQRLAIVVAATALVEGASFDWQTELVGVEPPPRDDGCGCRTPSTSGGSPLLLALLALRRRRLRSAPCAPSSRSNR